MPWLMLVVGLLTSYILIFVTRPLDGGLMAALPLSPGRDLFAHRRPMLWVWWWLGGWGLVKAVEIAARTCSSRAEGPSKPHELMSSLIVSISRRRASSSHCNTTFS